MIERHLTPSDLAGKVIDAHAHVGVGLQHYVNAAYPYCQSLEGLYYKQRAGGVDANVVFPFSADLHFDMGHLKEGRCVPAEEPFSRVPYEAENRLLSREVFGYCPELVERFLPFVCADPEREVDAQVHVIESIAAEHPVYGIKIVPVSVQSPLAALHDAGRPLLDLAEAMDMPLLFHVTAHKEEAWSRPEVALDLAEQHPRLRFCLAHCIGFLRGLLERADALPNVWVDTSAMKIQVELVDQGSEIMAGPDERFGSDYSDHRRVMQDLLDAFPDTIIWGTDSPAYSYICSRAQGDGVVEFRLKGTYEDEVAGLNALGADARLRACSTNTLAFLFGGR